MDFDTLYFGYEETEDFVKLAIEDGFIVSYDESISNNTKKYQTKKDLYQNDFFQRKKRKNMSSLLRMLLLFDNFDSNRLIPFDMSRLVDCGLILENSTITNNTNNTYRKNNDFIPEIKFSGLQEKLTEFYDQSDVGSFINALFINIDKIYGTNVYTSISEFELQELKEALENRNIDNFKRLIIDFEIEDMIIEKMRDHIYYFGTSENHKTTRKYAASIINRYIMHPVVELLSPFEDESSDLYKINKYYKLLNELYTINEYAICSSCLKRNTAECLNYLKCEYSLERYLTLIDLFTSLEMNIPVFSKYIKPINSQSLNSFKIIEDLYTLMERKDISKYIEMEIKQLWNLPTPSSIKEVIKWRQRDEMVSFRNIFKTWCESLQNYGDESTVKLITRDFNNASKFLERQKEKNNELRKMKTAIGRTIIRLICEIPGVSLLSAPHDLKKIWNDKGEADEKKKKEWVIFTK